MRHVSPEGLDQLEPLLEDLRTLAGLKEKKRGVFYRKSRAFLHFHEDPKVEPAELAADVRLQGDLFERYPANTRKDHAVLLRKIREVL